MRALALFEQDGYMLTKRDALEFQSFLLDHLPSWIDVKIESPTELILTGEPGHEFDPVSIEFRYFGTSNAKLFVGTSFDIFYNTSIAPEWRPVDAKEGDMTTILLTLNHIVGLCKIIRWLESQGFERTEPATLRRDEKQHFKFAKKLSGNVKAEVAFDSRLHSAYVQVGPDVDSFWTHPRITITPKTLKLVQHTVEQAIDEYEHTSDAVSKTYGVSSDNAAHLELKRK